MFFGRLFFTELTCSDTDILGPEKHQSLMKCFQMVVSIMTGNGDGKIGLKLFTPSEPDESTAHGNAPDPLKTD
jgi:hypothetical protein